MLHLCHGNQLEDLADRLALDLARPVSSVLAPDLIAVPGQGIARWLSLRLAHQQGIIANTLWQFPAELLWHLFRAVLPDAPMTNARLRGNIMISLRLPVSRGSQDPRPLYLPSAC